MKAIWNRQLLAESSATILVENNHYFPPESVNQTLLEASDTRTYCPWKGTASYYTLTVDGQRNTDAAWLYSEPKSAAHEIKSYIAFWNGVKVIED